MSDDLMILAYQKIAELFDKANETHIFTEQNMKNISDFQKGSKILGMVLAYYYFDFGENDKAVELLKHFNITITPDEFGLNRLINMIEIHQTMMDIKIIKKKTERKDEATYIEIICDLEEILDTRIDAETITLEKYIAKTKKAKEKINALKKQNKKWQGR
jgi:uncharacterized protein HemY